MANVTLIHDLCNENARDLTVFSNDLKDGYMNEGFHTVNYGGYTVMDVGHGVGKDAVENRILALYDLNNVIPKSGVITAAAWRMYINQNTCASGQAYQWQIARCTRPDWHEGWFTYDKYDETHDWTAPGGDYASPYVNLSASGLGYGSGTGWWTCDILTLVSDARASRGDILNMLFRRTDSIEAEGIVRFHTKEYDLYAPEYGHSPHVRITYTLQHKTFQVTIR